MKVAFTQSRLAHQLHQKLKFSSRRSTPKGRISLAVPDQPVSPIESHIHFNRFESHVHGEQIAKVKLITGLTEEFQRDLVKCSLDSLRARLMYYTYRMAVFTSDAGTIQFSCTYVDLLRRALEPEVANPKIWLGKDNYHQHAREYRRQISNNRGLADTDEVTACINDFLRFLHTWGI